MCINCNTVYFPSRIICRKCGRNTKMEEKKLSGIGTVYSYTTIFTPPEGFKDVAPYSIVAVKTEEGPVIEGHLINIDQKDIKIGMKVRTIFRKMITEGEEGLIFYHFKFEPITNKK